MNKLNNKDEVLAEIKQLKTLVKFKEKPFLSLSEAAEYLKIPKSTLYAYTSKKVIPFYKLQYRRIYFDKKELDGWILNKNNRHMTQCELESDVITRIVTER